MAYFQQGTLSINSQRLIANLLAQIVLLSDSMEVYREKLADIDFFDCIALFRYIDREEKGYLREKDFQRIVGTKHRKLLTYAFSWLDAMKVGEISRLEFSAFLLPKDNLELRELVAKRVEQPQLDWVQHETLLVQLNVFTSLLVEIMNREMKIIELRCQLLKTQDYSLEGVMRALDLHGHGWVCGLDLFNFLKNYGLDVDMRQVQKLVDAINCSLDGKVSEDQLRWTVEGFENGRKGYLGKIKDSNKKEVANPSSNKKQHQKSNKQEIKIQQSSDSQLNQHYRHLLQIYKMSQQQQRQVDQLLKQEQKQLTIQIDKQCQKFMTDYRLKIELIKRQQEAVKIKENEMKIMQEQRIKRQIFERQQDENKLTQLRRLQQIRRLEMLDRKVAYLRTVTQSPHYYRERSSPSPLKKQLLPSKYSPSKYYQSPQKLRQPLKRDYTNLTNLSRLTQVQSYRRPTSRSPKLPDSNVYLSDANHLKDVIKQQRQIERQIQQQFTSGRFDGNKYSSSSSFYTSHKPILTKQYTNESTNIQNEKYPSYKMHQTISPQKTALSAYVTRYATATSKFQQN